MSAPLVYRLLSSSLPPRGGRVAPAASLRKGRRGVPPPLSFPSPCACDLVCFLPGWGGVPPRHSYEKAVAARRPRPECSLSPAACLDDSEKLPAKLLLRTTYSDRTEKIYLKALSGLRKKKTKKKPILFCRHRKNGNLWRRQRTSEAHPARGGGVRGKCVGVCEGSARGSARIAGVRVCGLAGERVGGLAGVRVGGFAGVRVRGWMMFGTIRLAPLGCGRTTSKML